jgi:large subunit ribosomal protein L21
MFAIVRTGGKQVKVAVDQKVFVEKIDTAVGKEVVLDQVLMVAEGDKVTLGSPLVSGALVKASVEDQTRTAKVIVFKKKRRQNYRRKKGHRQHQTVLRITEISVGGKSFKATEKKTPVKKESAPKAEKAAAEAKPKAEKKPAEKKATKAKAS